jgi:hypothetical protein
MTSQPIAYTYQAELLCPTCVIEALINQQAASIAARDMNEEEVLDQVAGANAIDREDEHSFDSGDFPKVVFATQLEGDCERCGQCGDFLL